MSKPYAPSCDRNREAIEQVFYKIIKVSHKRLIEIGSGTGQHAVYLAPKWPHLQWVTSDRRQQHEGIKMWLKEANCENLKGPIELEIGKNQIPKYEFDVLFLANVLHIISWHNVQLLIKMIGESFGPESELIFYGPFNYNGEYTSLSNEKFDLWLKSKDQNRGIRSFEDISKALKQVGFILVNDYAMPANNRILHFKK